MTQEEVAARVEEFIRARFRVATEDRSFSRKSNLWEEGYLDSIGVVELISHIESTFDVGLPDEALFDPDFTNVEGIAKLVSALPHSMTAS